MLKVTKIQKNVLKNKTVIAIQQKINKMAVRVVKVVLKLVPKLISVKRLAFIIL